MYDFLGGRGGGAQAPWGQVGSVGIIIPSYHHIIMSSYHHIIISSYHHIIISSYHHTDIPPSHRVIIPSYDKTKNPHATFWRIQPIIPGFNRIVIRIRLNPGTIGRIRQKVACEIFELQTAQKSRGWLRFQRFFAEIDRVDPI